jgi:hypothetical protein
MAKSIRKILEKHGFDITKESSQYFIHQYTPEGEDWGFYVDRLKDVVTYSENFDPGEEFAMWVEAKRSGFRGVPGYAELWKDQLWKEEILNKVAAEIE